MNKTEFIKKNGGYKPCWLKSGTEVLFVIGDGSAYNELLGEISNSNEFG